MYSFDYNFSIQHGTDLLNELESIIPFMQNVNV